MLNLPKKYLSYSAIDTFLKRPAEFRKRYYENAPMVVTPELSFGKMIADRLENRHESVAHIKQYPKPEQQIKVNIGGVPIFGFIDSYDPETRSFLEYKTGRKPWTQTRVDKHLQLDIYSLAIEEIFGSVTDECELIWMETAKVEKPQVGLVAHEDSYGIELTGKVNSFPRTITKGDREATRQLIVSVAEAISKDYTKWQEERSVATEAANKLSTGLH